MKRKQNTAGLFLFLIFFLAGCGGIKGKLLIMEGNMMESRSRHNQAISLYTDALQYSDSAAYAEYNLGVVYLTMGEDEAAHSRFDNAGEIMFSASPAHSQDELEYRIHYNRGILYFHANDFAGAVSEFRKALEIDAGRIGAKRNLELS